MAAALLFKITDKIRKRCFVCRYVLFCRRVGRVCGCKRYRFASGWSCRNLLGGCICCRCGRCRVLGGFSDICRCRCRVLGGYGIGIGSGRFQLTGSFGRYRLTGCCGRLCLTGDFCRDSCISGGKGRGGDSSRLLRGCLAAVSFVLYNCLATVLFGMLCSCCYRWFALCFRGGFICGSVLLTGRFTCGSCRSMLLLRYGCAAGCHTFVGSYCFRCRRSFLPLGYGRAGYGIDCRTRYRIGLHCRF